MNVFAVWLGACRKRCEALFASKRAGTDLKTKSVKRNEIPQRGQFNIMLDYGRKRLFNIFSEGGVKEKGGEFPRPVSYFSKMTICKIARTMLRDTSSISNTGLDFSMV